MTEEDREELLAENGYAGVIVEPLRNYEPELFDLINAEFHRKWREAKDTEKYNKREWLNRQSRLNSNGIGV